MESVWVSQKKRPCSERQQNATRRFFHSYCMDIIYTFLVGSSWFRDNRCVESLKCHNITYKIFHRSSIFRWTCRRQRHGDWWQRQFTRTQRSKARKSLTKKANYWHVSGATVYFYYIPSEQRRKYIVVSDVWNGRRQSKCQPRACRTCKGSYSVYV